MKRDNVAKNYPSSDWEDAEGLGLLFLLFAEVLLLLFAEELVLYGRVALLIIVP